MHFNKNTHTYTESKRGAPHGNEQVPFLRAEEGSSSGTNEHTAISTDLHQGRVSCEFLEPVSELLSLRLSI
jgi:hypothetical protein